MIQEEVRNEMIKAMKEKRVEDKNLYSLFLSRLKNRAIEERVETLSDDLAISEAKKMIKTLTEEIEMNKKAGREKEVESLSYQVKLVEKYVPAQMSEDQIRSIISTLEDKSIKSVMIHFKNNYAGKVDMSAVSKIAKEFNV